MNYDIITIAPTVSDNAHATGDVMFNLTEVDLPKGGCKLINAFMEVANGGGEDSTKIGLLFFKKATAALGTLNETANISAANFTANEYIGSTFLNLASSPDHDLDVIDTTALYYGYDGLSNVAAARGGSPPCQLILAPSSKDFTSKSPSVRGSKVYIAGVIHAGAPNFDGTDNVKIHLHVEY